MALTTGLAQTELVDEKRFMTQAWQTHFRDVTTSIAKAPEKQSIVQLPQQAGGFFGSFPVAGLAAGLYRVSASVRVKTPADTSSSVALSLLWTDGGLACSEVLIAPVTGNTPSSTGSGEALIRIDGGTPISYSVSYASVAANVMVYELRLVLEAMGGT